MELDTFPWPSYPMAMSTASAVVVPPAMLSPMTRYSLFLASSLPSRTPFS